MALKLCTRWNLIKRANLLLLDIFTPKQLVAVNDMCSLSKITEEGKTCLPVFLEWVQELLIREPSKLLSYRWDLCLHAREQLHEWKRRVHPHHEIPLELWASITNTFLWRIVECFYCKFVCVQFSLVPPHKSDKSAPYFLYIHLASTCDEWSQAFPFLLLLPFHTIVMQLVEGGPGTTLITVYLSTTLTSDKLGDPISFLMGLHRGCPGEGVKWRKSCFAFQAQIQGKVYLACR